MTHHVMVVLAYKDPRWTDHTETLYDGVEWEVNERNTLIVTDKNGKTVKTYASHEWEMITTVGLEVTEENNDPVVVTTPFGERPTPSAP